MDEVLLAAEQGRLTLDQVVLAAEQGRLTVDKVVLAAEGGRLTCTSTCHARYRKDSVSSGKYFTTPCAASVKRYVEPTIFTCRGDHAAWSQSCCLYAWPVGEMQICLISTARPVFVMYHTGQIVLRQEGLHHTMECVERIVASCPTQAQEGVSYVRCPVHI